MSASSVSVLTPPPDAGVGRAGPSRPARTGDGGALLMRGAVGAFLGVLVVIPLAAVAYRSASAGPAEFWEAVTAPQSLAALRLSLIVSFVVAALNAVTGTLIAWVLVRDDFRGKGLVNAIIDLPFALPTIVAGLTLVALYGPRSPIGVNAAYTTAAVLMALLFVTLPFVVRAVQPVLAEIDREAEEAALSLGAGGWTTFRLIVLPALLPAILSGMGLGFARAIGEFGSVVLISGNIPFETEVAAVRVFTQVENDNIAAAASIAVVLMVVSLLILFVIDRFERRSRRHDG